MGLPHLPSAEIMATAREVEDAIRAATAPLPSNGRPRRTRAPMPGGVPKLIAPTRFDATQAGELATIILDMFKS
jgi:hypothetical protein